MSLLFVVGMRREARILGPDRRILVGTDGLDEALADKPAGVVSFGLCGALAPELEVGDLVCATAVVTSEGEFAVDEALSSSLVDRVGRVSLGKLAGSDLIVPDPKAKSALGQGCSAIATDMESHKVARAAARAGVPFAVLRAVSDRANEALPASAQAGFRPDGTTDILAVITTLARHPSELPALLRTARHAGVAFTALERAAAVL